MITAITLENFKGISQPATIPLRPLTIMFGKNSAGKSTVVQALHYAREIFERNNLNADHTQLGGASVDLGGFRNLVNNHDDTKTITMRFEMDLRETDLPDYDFSPTLAYKAIRNEVGEEFDSEEAKEMEISFRRGLDILSSRTESVGIELKVEWSEILERPILTSYKTIFNEIEAVQVLTSTDD
jgi:predicted ATPase